MGAVTSLNKAQSKSPIFDYFLEQLGLYIGNKVAIVGFQIVSSLLA